MFKEKKIQEYWEDPKTVSLIDENLHLLEIEAVKKHLLSSDSMIDIGCGDGVATVEYAKCVSKCLGIERSRTLLKKAVEHVTAAKSRALIFEGDIKEFCGDEKYDVVVTQRVLINLPSWLKQKKAMKNIFNALKPGGRYIMVEDFDDGLDNLNKMRVSMGLSEIKRHWHNLFLDQTKVQRYSDEIGLVRTAHHDFNLYYLLTRVFFPMFVQLPPDNAFVRISDGMARKLQEKYGQGPLMGDYLCISPIKVLVFEKPSHRNW